MFYVDDHPSVVAKEPEEVFIDKSSIALQKFLLSRATTKQSLSKVLIAGKFNFQVIPLM